MVLSLFTKAQQVQSLPAGKYETTLKEQSAKWERGDIIILDENKYRITSSHEVGEYKFSVTAQRVFFTSGPLKSVFAKTAVNSNAPAIILPASENEQLGMRLASADVWGSYRQ